jgi:hypothetical protein
MISMAPREIAWTMTEVALRTSMTTTARFERNSEGGPMGRNWTSTSIVKNYHTSYPNSRCTPRLPSPSFFCP